MNDQSVGNELDSARRAGEPATGEAKPGPRKRRPVELRGSVQKRRRGHVGWLETEWSGRTTR